MDEYTLKTKLWLDERYRMVDSYGVYLAHQPIYGYRAGHCEPGVFERYFRTYQIMRSLARLDFGTLLDVGGSEGYKAALARELFGVEVTNSDLSEEGCTRAREIYGVAARPADVHELPFRDGEFDVVLCSETLEHIVDFERAVRELTRVAAKAVIITVPHEPAEEVEKHASETHAHFHALDLNCLDFLKADGHEVRARKMICRFTKEDIANRVIEKGVLPLNVWPRRRFALELFNRVLLPIGNRLLRHQRFAALVLMLDEILSPRAKIYDAILIEVLKDKDCLRSAPRPCSAFRVVDFKRPLHYLTTERSARGEAEQARWGDELARLTPASPEQKRTIAHETKDIVSCTDFFAVWGQSVKFAGWAHINDLDSTAATTRLVLQSANRTYIGDAPPIQRTDVTAAFTDNLDLDRSGFSFQLDTRGLEKGRYRLGLLIEQSGRAAFQFTGKVIMAGE